MYKVGVWGPGSMGLIALRGVIDHPQLQLVDLVVHSDAKAGRDAGELCGIDQVGVPATQDPAGAAGRRRRRSGLCGRGQPAPSRGDR